jgi:prepilin-type N-terminal cleavage/methylation domain-containing protein
VTHRTAHLRPSARHLTARPQGFSFRHGFSFIEVLFALAVLAVGFIMIAAIFPVAIRQTEATVDAAAAQTVADHATQSILAVAKSSDLPDTGGRISRLPAPVLQRLAGSFIYPSDPRYAFTAAYERTGSNDPIVYLYILRSREESTFDPAKFVAMEDVPNEPTDLSNPPTVNVGNHTAYVGGVGYDGITANNIPNNVKNSRQVGTGRTQSGMTIGVSDGTGGFNYFVLGRNIATGNTYLLPNSAFSGTTADVVFYPGRVSAFEPQDVPIAIRYGLSDDFTETEATTIEFLDDLGAAAASPGAIVLLADNNPRAMAPELANPNKAPDPDDTNASRRRASQPIAKGAIIRLGQRVTTTGSNASRVVYEVASITDASGNLIEIDRWEFNVEPYEGDGTVETTMAANNRANPRAFIVGPPLEKPWLPWDASTNKFKAAPPLDLAVLPITLQGLN